MVSGAWIVCGCSAPQYRYARASTIAKETATEEQATQDTKVFDQVFRKRPTTAALRSGTRMIAGSIQARSMETLPSVGG